MNSIIFHATFWSLLFNNLKKLILFYKLSQMLFFTNRKMYFFHLLRVWICEFINDKTIFSYHIECVRNYFFSTFYLMFFSLFNLKICIIRLKENRETNVDKICFKCNLKRHLYLYVSVCACVCVNYFPFSYNLLCTSF